MKSIYSVFAAFTVVAASSAPALAWDMPGMGEDAETKHIKAECSTLVRTTYRATLELLESAEALQLAAGNKAEAERIGSLMKKLNESKPDDPQALKAVAKEVSDIGQKAAVANAAVTKLSEKEKQMLLNGVMSAGVAGLMDGMAVMSAKSLSEQVTSMVKTAASNPLKLASLKDVADTALFIGTFVPSQASSVKGISESLGKYVKSNGLSMPSVDQIKKAAEAAQKE